MGCKVPLAMWDANRYIAYHMHQFLDRSEKKKGVCGALRLKGLALLGWLAGKLAGLFSRMRQCGCVGMERMPN